MGQAEALRAIRDHRWNSCEHATPTDCLAWARDVAARALR